MVKAKPINFDREYGEVNPNTKCFACSKPLRGKPYIADTRDDQLVYVGPDCFKKIKTAGEAGYQPPLGGPKLYRCKQ